MALNVLLSVALARMFGWMGYAAFGGLALALSVATALETLALFFVLARRTPEIKPRVALRALGKSAIGALAMIFGIYIWMAVRGDAAWATLVAVGIAVFVYFDVMWLLKSEEAQYVVSLLGVLGSRRGMRDEG
jgi:peptidoglycan biosynthesis protein MviN/MurJ (putative lipid II flippase)